MAIHFTSDTHYFHRNVIKYCKRPFLKDPELGYEDENLDVDGMNAKLISNWNEVVKPDDWVYHLGDFMMGPDAQARTKAIRKQLNGRIVLILGNHDRSRKFYLDNGFDDVARELSCSLHGTKVFMRHHPPVRPEAWCDDYDIVLCGHVHEQWLHHGKVVNVGVDQWGFKPVTLDNLLKVNEPGYIHHRWQPDGH